jgi:hypothetical protein
MLTLADRPTPAPHTSFESIEGQTVIINLKTGVYFSLNTTGTFMWERLDGHATLGEIAAALSEVCDVEIGVTEPDVLSLATELQTEGLLRI